MVRDGVTQTIPVMEVVPGELAVVSAGEPWPADGMVLHGEELQADESALTGEAYPVRKRPLGACHADDEVPIEGVHWGFAGTRLLTGRRPSEAMRWALLWLLSRVPRKWCRH